MSEPLISIIVPVYNVELYLNKCIDSIVDQTYENLEIILINDGSKDSSPQICDEYAKNDNRIIVIHQSNAGPSEARNKGISNATGKYIMFVDSDDTCEPTFVETLKNKIESSSSQLVMCGINKVNGKNIKPQLFDKVIESSNKEDIKDNFYYYLSSGLFNSLYNKIFVNSIIKDNKIKLDNKMSIGEDFCFVLNYFDYIYSVSIVNMPLYNYYISNSYLTYKYRPNIFEMRKISVERLKEFLGKNKIKDNITDFLYIKLAYACFMQLSHNQCKMKYSEKIQYIKNILNDDVIKLSINNYIPDSFSKKMLHIVLKTNNYFFIFIFSRLIYKIRKMGIILFKTSV